MKGPTSRKEREKWGILESCFSTTLPLPQPIQRIEKIRIGNHSSIGSRDLGVPFRAQRRHRKRHCDPVISERIELCSVQPLSPGNSQTIFELLDLRSHGAQISRNAGDSVRLFYAKLTGISNFDSLRRV